MRTSDNGSTFAASAERIRLAFIYTTTYALSNGADFSEIYWTYWSVKVQLVGETST